jgi:hypothetical protein
VGDVSFTGVLELRGFRKLNFDFIRAPLGMRSLCRHLHMAQSVCLAAVTLAFSSPLSWLTKRSIEKLFFKVKKNYTFNACKFTLMDQRAME